MFEAIALLCWWNTTCSTVLYCTVGEGGVADAVVDSERKGPR